MNPETILQKVQETYKGFESYSDDGTVDMVPAVGKTSTEFKTYFLKPSKMRFEWRDWHPYFGKEKAANESAIWSDGEHSHMLCLGQLTHPQLTLAIAGAFGVSYCSVSMILSLLLPECLDYAGMWLQMRDIQMLDDEVTNGFSCYHLVGTTIKHGDREAWIGMDDYIVRRLRAKTDINEQEATEQHEMMMAAMKAMPVSDVEKVCQAAGLKDAEALADLYRKGNSGALKFHYDYNYTQVVVNQAMADDLFGYDPSTPPRISTWSSE